jgi:preprotein translocase subunit SecD
MCFSACDIDYSQHSISDLKKKHPGVYLEVEPVYAIAYEKALADYGNDLRINLKKNNLRFISLFHDNRKIVVKFFNADDRFAGYQWIKTYNTENKLSARINRSDANNEFSLKITLTKDQFRKIDRNVRKRISAIIKKRGELLEASFTRVTPVNGKLAVYLVNADKVKLASTLIRLNRMVYFSEAKKKNNANSSHIGTVDREDIKDKDGIVYSVSTRTIITNNHIDEVTPGFGANNTPAIQVTLNEAGTRLMIRATSKLINKTIVAVVSEYDFARVDNANTGNSTSTPYQINKMVISAATVKTPIGQQFMITGLKNVDTAQLYSYQFASGYYPVPIRIIKANKVVPARKTRSTP